MSMTITAVTLARAQFGFTIAFHIIFPAMSIGLASYLAVLEGAWLVTRKPAYLAVYRYWLTIFAVVFGIGVVSGLVMSYEFGTNWAGFAFRAGPIVGPLMGCGLAVMAGYTLLGSCWLIWRTEGGLQQRCRRHARTMAVTVLALIVIVTLWTPMLQNSLSARWFRWPDLLFTAWVPVLVVLLAIGLFRSLSARRHLLPLVFSYGIFVLCYAGLLISLYPYLVPPSISFRDAAAPHDSLLFLLVGAAITIPMILAYTLYGYSVFKGKMRAGEGYH
ncbi:cytochrome d ubiquinol oxidase subunit II [Paraburkholderia sp. MMS20-SJTN17]|uniref:Cytochrome d ubiquinol oxidase subunit II n=1 Tax=Paraburkholderia translucens TaxID=2886945 RepID=A0ABS8KGY4_9BURK|nr:cytochrome d ubiquinol oxidase subunit II [Paraburkholderia sp. MMS20-SJTN17]MCC8404040.1 cytochrome d ubiquinol oxidase subunit II [Paraburkholderia sp. MMS20-SJTN17]